MGSRSGDLGLLVGLLKNGAKPTEFVLNKTLSCCVNSLSLGLGEQVHGMAVKLGVGLDVYVCNPLIDLYGKCGMVWDAHKLFDEMSRTNVVTWNSLMFGYLRVRDPEVAVRVFLGMQRSGVGSTAFSISAILMACAHLEDAEHGNMVQCLYLKSGLCDNVVVGTGLIDVYSMLGDVDRCMQIFDEMPDRNVITWTTMLWVREMKCLGLRPNGVIM